MRHGRPGAGPFVWMLGLENNPPPAIPHLGAVRELMEVALLESDRAVRLLFCIHVRLGISFGRRVGRQTVDVTDVVLSHYFSVFQLQ